MNLVYAYACGEPVSGWTEAQAEMERQRALWDACVTIEREMERQEILIARSDDAALDDMCQRIEALSLAMDAASGEEFQALRKDRRALYAERKKLLSAWRKSNKPKVQAIEAARRAAVKAAHQDAQATTASDPEKVLFWANANRVIGDYETARRTVKQFGRRLQLSDEARMDGVLTVQIQRTRSGLGAAPRELQDGTYGNLAIGMIPPGADKLAHHKRTAARKVMMEMRADADGNMLRAPVYLHRDMPEIARVKLAQFVWRMEGGKMTYGLRLTLGDLPQPAQAWTNGAACAVSLRAEDRAGLVLGVVADAQGERETLRLSGPWTAKAKLCEKMKSDLQAEISGLREAWRDISLPALVRECLFGKRYAPPPALLHEVMDACLLSLPRAVRAWRDGRGGGKSRYQSWSGMRLRLLRSRREQMRLMARDLASRYGVIVLPDTDFAAAQREDERDDFSAAKWACLHELRKEIQHQAVKAGGRVVIAPADDDPRRLLASGLVIAASETEKTQRAPRHVRRREGKSKKSAALAESSQAVDAL